MFLIRGIFSVASWTLGFPPNQNNFRMNLKISDLSISRMFHALNNRNEVPNKIMARGKQLHVDMFRAAAWRFTYYLCHEINLEYLKNPRLERSPRTWQTVAQRVDQEFRKAFKELTDIMISIHVGYLEQELEEVGLLNAREFISAEGLTQESIKIDYEVLEDHYKYFDKFWEESPHRGQTIKKIFDKASEVFDELKRRGVKDPNDIPEDLLNFSIEKVKVCI